MARRVQYSIQNSLRFLSSPSYTFQIPLNPRTIRTHRSPKHSSSGGGALYCTCRSADDPFVLATPLCYVNGPPHMGSAYTTIAADAIARFQVEKAQQHDENLELSTACETVLETGNAGNVFIDEKAPRSLFKQGGAAFQTAAKLACPTSALFRTSFSFLRKFSTTESVGEAAGASANKPKRKKKKNFFEVAQFLPNWGIGYHMAKTHWTGVSYQITKINLYKDGRHGKAWGIAHKAGVPATDAPKKISGVHKRCWRYIANSNKTEESTSKLELQTV